MGWANCGKDSVGRPIGYAHRAPCDERGCKARIHRGLAYACGGMHGDGEAYCEGYFCTEHLSIVETKSDAPEGGCGSHVFSVCARCEKMLKAEGYLVDEEDEDTIPLKSGELRHG